jgi:hypothetical protein
MPHICSINNVKQNQKQRKYINLYISVYEKNVFVNKWNKYLRNDDDDIVELYEYLLIAVWIVDSVRVFVLLSDGVEVKVVNTVVVSSDVRKGVGSVVIGFVVVRIELVVSIKVVRVSVVVVVVVGSTVVLKSYT